MPFLGVVAVAMLLVGVAAQVWAAEGPEILTPRPPPTPRINGPSVFGVRPNSPFIYRIPATGQRPMEFAIENLPNGLTVDAKTGQVSAAFSIASRWSCGTGLGTLIETVSLPMRRTGAVTISLPTCAVVPVISRLWRAA